MNEQDERPSHGNPIREAETAEEDQFTAKIRFTNRGRSAILPVIEVGFLCLFGQFVLNNRFGTRQPSRASQRGLMIPSPQPLSQGARGTNELNRQRRINIFFKQVRIINLYE